MVAARLYVPPPTFTPLPYGLLSALGSEIRNPRDKHWQTGVTYESLCGTGAASTYDECFVVTGSGLNPTTPPEPEAKSATNSMDVRGATPFTVYAEVDCSAPGFWNRANEMVGDALTRSEQWQVERAFWTGEAAGQPVVHPHLASDYELYDDMNILLQTAATVVTGSALPALTAVGLLEEAIAGCYDGVAVLHLPRRLGVALANQGVLVREGSRYRTITGNIVVFGAGYPGTAPDGTDDGNTWIYATGSMFIYRSNATIHRVVDSFDRANNTVRAIAERTYVIGWDCCHYAIPISNNIGE